MEPRFGVDFSHVRVHTGSNAIQMNRDVGAQAFTHGSDIYYGAGSSPTNLELTAHELTHVVQQTGAAPLQMKAADKLFPANADPSLHRGCKACETHGNEEKRSQPDPSVVSEEVLQKKADLVPLVEGGNTLHHIQRAPAASSNEPIVSSEIVDISTGIFNPSEKVKGEIEAQRHKGLMVRVVAKGVTEEGQIKVKGDKSKKYDSMKNGATPLLNPWTQQLGGMHLNFSIKDNEVKGHASLKPGSKDKKEWLQALQKNSAMLGGLGLKVGKLPNPVNEFSAGKLTLGVTGLDVELAGFLDAKFNLTLENTNKPKIEGSARVDVKGMASGELKLDNAQEKLAGELSLAINIKAFSGSAKVKYNTDGTVGIGGKAAYNANKLSGEIQFVATDLDTANNFSKEAIAGAGGIEKAQDAKAPAAVPSPKPGKKQRALAATGQLTFNLTKWFAGTVFVVVDGKGDVTVIGRITPPAEIPLFDQKNWDEELVKLEAKAYYGLPVVGNLNLFANISLHALANLGPAKIYNIEVLGTYSTDPEIQKNIQISGSINISAYAGLRLRAEGGAGVEIVEHDLKFGIGLNADVGVKAYAEARPTIGYREPGQFYISGTLEMVAQPMLGLGGDFFIELDTPWWSPLSDDKWTWPLFSKEWPLSDPIGISASLKDYVLGSKQVPEIEMKKPEFDPSKFLTSMVDDTLPEKSGGQAAGQGTFKDDGSVPTPTIPPKKEAPVKVDAKGEGPKKRTPPARGKSATPDPKVANEQENSKIFQDAAKPLKALEAKTPLTRADLDQELALIKKQVNGIDFKVQQRGTEWIVTPKAGRKMGKGLELDARLGGETMAAGKFVRDDSAEGKQKGKEKEKADAAGPDTSEASASLQAGLAELSSKLDVAAKGGLAPNELSPIVTEVKTKYGFKVLEVREEVEALILHGEINPKGDKTKGLRKLTIKATLPQARLIENPGTRFPRDVAIAIDRIQETINDLYREFSKYGDASSAFMAMKEQYMGGVGKEPSALVLKKEPKRKQIRTELRKQRKKGPDGKFIPVKNADGSLKYRQKPDGSLETDKLGQPIPEVEMEEIEVPIYEKKDGRTSTRPMSRARRLW